MKKVLIIGLAIILIVGLVATIMILQNPNSTPITSTQPTTNNTEPTSPTPPIGDPVEDEDLVNFHDENSQQYTPENLPSLYKSKDFDGDGLKNKDEISAGTDMYKVDTDGDGIGDYDEINKTKTDPLKWSSRDDGVSDLEYSIVNGKEFEAGWTTTDANGFKIYQEKAEDRLCVVSKTSTDAFNDLETISEAFQIKYFSGKIALNCNKYVADVANSIAIYKDVDGIATKIESAVDENNLVVFELSENDVFVVAYEP